MKWITEPEQKIPVVADVDVVVCGGGVAGFAAALSAARNKCSVLLIEKYGFLGGAVTAMLVITPTPMNNGINLELANRLSKLGAYAPCRGLDGNQKKDQLHAVDPEILKHELIEMLQSENVKLLLHTYIAKAIVEDNAVKGVIIENKAGRQFIRARIVIDTTGDADVAISAGVPFATPDKPIAVTMMFNMADVDVPKVQAKVGTYGNLRRVVQEAIDAGDFSYDLGLTQSPWGYPGVYAANLLYQGELNVWGGNLDGIDAVDPDQLTKAEIITRDRAIKLANFFKKSVPGFEKSRIEYMSTEVGIRYTRRIMGDFRPSFDDVTTKNFDDAVAKPYQHRKLWIPYRCLIPKEVENLLVAGRCMSTQDDAHPPLCTIPPCLSAGQAAGTAAALALEKGVKPRNLDVPLLQKTIIEQGMELE